MPHIIHGEPTTNVNVDGMRENYEYDYPDGLDLDPRSELSKDLVKKVLSRARTSHNGMSKRFPNWNLIDKTLTAYIPLSDEEEKSKNKDSRKPVSIVFPYTHAILESLLSYMLAAFNQSPIFQYEGHGPNDVMGAILLTKMIDLHCTHNKVGLSLHTMFRDNFAYGSGYVVPTWKVKKGKRRSRKDVGFMSSLKNKFVRTGENIITKDAILFEGNDLINIDPYLALPDPNVPAHKVQEGEFFGWIEQTNLIELLDRERADEDYFNVRYLKHLKNYRTSITNDDNSGREVRTGSRSKISDDDLRPLDIIHMYVNLIPKEWKLGDSEYPEKWYLQIGADSIVILAKPVGLNHGMFPVATCSSDYDGYSTTPVARLEMLYGLQGTLDWLFNSHIANVRKAINDMFVYDPYLINSNDLENPKEGWLIRTRKPAWGKGVKDAIQQLAVQDVTRQNVGDSSWIVQWMEKIGSTDSAMMGSLRHGGPDRLSSAEFQGTKQGGFNRLERMAKIIGMQAMQDIGYFFAIHAQQMATESTYINVLGDWQSVLMQEYGRKIQRGRMAVSPGDILVDFNIQVRDGSIPGSNYSPVWERMFEVVAKDGELRQQFDIVKIFRHIARNNGAKNVDDFVRMQVQSDQQVLNGVQKGNLVPLQESSYANGQ